jgi:transcriptional regulator with XRE-family HTH domain
MLRTVTDDFLSPCNPWRMAKKKPRQFIREWRKHRGLTQEQLAERMGIARSYISHVEKGKRRYDQLFLESAANALLCEPADLIMRDPTQLNAIWTIWEQIAPEDRERAARILETFTKKTGTHN